ncbi:MAG: glycogen debranching enzyme N-terminal domain-containing protein [Gemmatimonadetes bacterium]|nr:glycogen debranching enzyme N-terminal domain-containing protein [Gemmatimonadota bacterium]
MTELVRTLSWEDAAPEDQERLLAREWLVTNGLGGYASSTVYGVSTRRYHGLLIAALPAPLGRVVMLNHLLEEVRLPDGSWVRLGGEERPEALELYSAGNLREFRLAMGLPVWRYEVEGYVLEKRLFMPHRQNTTYVTYRLLSGEGRLRLRLRPALHFRPHEAPVDEPFELPYTLTVIGERYEITGEPRLPALRLLLLGENRAFTSVPENLPEFLYRVEEARGYEFTGNLWSPGHFRADLAEGIDATLVASTEGWATIQALDPEQALEIERSRRSRLLTLAAPAAQTGVAAELVLAADEFIITPAGRLADAARAHAEGDEIRTVIAGYHWFTDWGRDTMISLEGLTLTTGRKREAGYILRTFAHYVRDGLIPNMFPDRSAGGLYHTADATLWFFHAVDRYLEATGDRSTLQRILPKLREIVEHHLRGTRFGIGVDPRDGLLRQGAEGYQLTWMDAKVDGWVVTPRRGKAVEINALWYNALRLLEGWVREEIGEGEAASLAEQAERARDSFNRRFWYAEGGYLYDVVDAEGGGDDPACRPNQIFAISLPHAVLDQERWEPVLNTVRDRLLTPVGLRSLSRDHPDYRSVYQGDLPARDAAYHQGTVWGWLIGPFVDAWLKVHPDDRTGARDFLQGFVDHLDEFGIGSIAEIFDAEAPFVPRGCIAQAWSIAEVLRCWVKTE